MLMKDVSLTYILYVGTGLGILAVVLAFVVAEVVARYNPGQEMIREMRAALFFQFFFMLILLAIFVRAVSFFYGKYFAICRRAALGTWMSDEDQGGLVDLAYALGIIAISLLPAILTATLAAWYADRAGADSEKAELLFWTFVPITWIWAYYYFPMGMAAVALRKSLDPFVVLSWTWKAMPEYLYYLLMMLPFHLAVGLMSYALSNFIMDNILMLAGMLPMLLGAYLIGIFLEQYNIVVGLVALGRVLRRNESQLHWYKYAKDM
jgi:hypothetical protein